MKLFSEKKLSAQQAVKMIKNGDRVAIGHACGEPQFEQNFSLRFICNPHVVHFIMIDSL